MPSSKNYVRDYKQETKTSDARGERPGNILRKRARRVLVKEGVAATNDGKDVDHKTPLSKGGGNSRGNLRAKSTSANRSFARTSSGAIKKT